MLNTFRDFIASDGKILKITPTPEGKLVTRPTRIASERKGIELTVGKQSLRLYPETPVTSRADAHTKDWILVDPDHYFSSVGGFVRLERGQTILIGRANPTVSAIFNFPKSVMRRHLVLANDDGEIIIKPLDGESTTYVSSVPESAGVDWLMARRMANLSHLRRIFGGPIELLEPHSAMTTIEQVHAILTDEAYRPKDSQDRPGGLLDLPETLAPIVVGDIHAQVDNLLTILSLEGCLDGLERGDTCLLFLGDTVHREGDGELEEMDSSLLTLDLLFKLKSRFPENVFFLRGNHESFDGEVGKGGVPQARLLWHHARALRGKKYAKRLAECFEMLASVARSRNFVACHGGPPRRKLVIGDVIELQNNPDLNRELLWNRMRRTGRLDGYTKKDVKRFRKALEAEKETPFIVSHTPLSRTGAVWTDAGDIRAHHIMFSANPNRLAIFIRSGGEMIPLEYPSEPLLEFANSLST
jgi:Calcineurin-like phosphoesterase